jgi:hypothetical protein
VTQSDDTTLPSETPDEVTHDRCIESRDGKSLLRLGEIGLTRMSDIDRAFPMHSTITKHATLLYEAPAVVTEGRYVGTWHSPLVEYCYEFRGHRMYCYVVMTRFDVDAFGEECWTTDRRMSAGAAADTILAARKLVRCR